MCWCIGVAHGRQPAMSLWQEIANMMAEPVENVGSCGMGCCVVIDGESVSETLLLEVDQKVVSPDDPCQIYTCTVRE